ncbi:YpbF family protein [Bacillus kwashiorkori]|uniref:YpbF family protein n=1 Tax=Bacillus kwashiorkori TaxID=1522318 RepID=UPI000783F3F2|nr:YpbF family protein [Bacillus kwashiorkori]
MDEIIKNLNDWTDEATKQMLQSVVKKKRKFDKLKIRHLLVMWITMFFALMFSYYLYKTVYLPYSYSFAAMFSAFVNNSYNGVLLVFIISLYGFMNVLKQKVDKIEGEFHALRCEIIDKSKDLWKSDEAWRKRHEVFYLLKNHYDINLFHENK